jgi:O-antigen ligase
MRLKTKRKIIVQIITFCLIFPLFPVNAFEVGNLYDYLAIADVGLIVLLYITNVRVFPKHIIFPMLFAITLCISCILNDRSVIPGIFYGGKLLAFYMLNEMYFRRESMACLNTIKYYFAVLFVITLIFQIVAPEYFGVTDLSNNNINFFVGDNELGYYFVSFICICIITDLFKEDKISFFTKILVVICCSSMYIAWSATGIVGLALFILYLIFIYGNKLQKVFDFKRTVICYGLIFFGVVFYNVQDNFSTFIVDILQKNVTLTGRTYIWVSAIENIKASPIYGYGTVDGGRLVMNTTGGGSFASSHNLFLEITLQAGFIGLTLFICIILASLYHKNRFHTNKEETIYHFVLFTSFIQLVMYISSPTVYSIVSYFPLLICSNIDRLFGNSTCEANIEQGKFVS